jgi:hypothetical protein
MLKFQFSIVFENKKEKSRKNLIFFLFFLPEFSLIFGKYENDRTNLFFMIE